MSFSHWFIFKIEGWWLFCNPWDISWRRRSTILIHMCFRFSDLSYGFWGWGINCKQLKGARVLPLYPNLWCMNIPSPRHIFVVNVWVCYSYGSMFYTQTGMLIDLCLGCWDWRVWWKHWKKSHCFISKLSDAWPFRHWGQCIWWSVFHSITHGGQAWWCMDILSPTEAYFGGRCHPVFEEKV